MSGMLSRLERPFMKVAEKLGQQPHLNAIRDGVVGALPLVLIGSLFMLVIQPPLLTQGALDAYAARPFVADLKVAFITLVGLVGLYVAFGVAHSLAKRYDQDTLSAGLLAAAALLLVNGVQATQTLAPGAWATVTGGGSIPADQLGSAVSVVKGLPFTNLGSGGLFMAILIGLFVPEVQRLARKYHLEIRMPDGVPPAVGRSFSALIPGLLVLIPLWAVVHLFDVDLFALLTKYLTGPIQAMSEVSKANPQLSMTLVFAFMLIVILIDSVLWLLGVHAVAILAPMAAIWTFNITSNMNDGTHLLQTRETLQFLIWTGGSGATLVLPFLLLRAKAVSLRAIAKIGAIPALFNINEPIIFGVPVMMNPTLMIPFILAPIVALTTTVIATSTGLVPVPSLMVPWTLPGPLGAFLATRGAWQAAVLSAVNITLAGLIYWPFVRALDRKTAAAEAGA